ncbi:geranylgeranyl transferase type-1 subunit beta isoform X1 [Nymphaea colorata]|nr:geranylgeranyl transferase type-1 subunit beta isoform X1 [Nymphaea colorata]XP_031486459.1 geranylgeranyl transferase type-1 subunit beta isoform X1 [Nymphaea colorata]XP_031486460.1 geranylgeranyl transferase type-1 subunit beta isoform X1 [Nymphaea colorata]
MNFRCCLCSVLALILIDSMDDALDTLASSFKRDLHVRFLQMMMESLPLEYELQDINRLTLAYFVISGLDILGALGSVERDRVVDWVLSLQALSATTEDLKEGQFYGFLGCSNSKFPTASPDVSCISTSNLASTYCALCILKTVGYDLKNVNCTAISISMQCLQQPDGSFMPIDTGAERDLRFVFCAAAVCHMLNDWSGMDKNRAKKFILSCQSYDGGFGLTPGSESHGGGTYCAVAALKLMGFINDGPLSSLTESIDFNLPLLLEWSLQRQAVDGGFQGRSNKASDSCYAFWVGAVLKLLGAENFLDKDALRGFLFSCQTKYGGFSKFPGDLPDLYHAYFSFSAFSLLEEPGLNRISAELGITVLSAMGTLSG